MEIVWGSWIEHDGKAPVASPCDAVKICYQRFDDGLIKPPDEDDYIRSDWPGFFWSWQIERTGWFSFRRVRVCHRAAYFPIIRYRFGRVRGQAAMSALRDLARDPAKVPVTLPDAEVMRPVPKREPAA